MKRKWKKIHKRHGSFMYYLVYYEVEEKTLGLGGHIVDVKKPSGEILRGRQLSIVASKGVQILLLDCEQLSEKDLRELEFNFSNKDY